MDKKKLKTEIVGSQIILAIKEIIKAMYFLFLYTINLIRNFINFLRSEKLRQGIHDAGYYYKIIVFGSDKDMENLVLEKKKKEKK